MMTATHKTFGGMARATERVIEELGGATISDEREYQRLNKRVKALCAELNALWSNPADSLEAAKLKARLVESWNAATS
jgi:hypothetical protein